jgi:integrase
MTKQPWNKNKSVGQKKPFTPRQIEMLKEFLGNAGKVKELALFSLGIDSMLRCSDLLKLKVEDVSDFKGKIKSTIQLRQKKTSQGHQVRIGKSTIKALENLIKKEKKFEDDYLFTTERYPRKAMGRVYYSGLIKEWCKYLHLDPRDYSTHSIRRTRASIVYKQTGNIEAVRQLLGQKSVTSTSAYLNLGQNEAFDIYEEFLD